MKRFYILAIISLFGSNLSAQTPCDSLIINCCNFDLVGDDTVSLTVINTNMTNELFDYPGFLLLASNGDTLAKETVNYFGIGSSMQTHYMQVQNPIVLPLTATLELWGGFYSTFYCSFPMSFGINGINEISLNHSVYPNPVLESIEVQGIEQGSYSVFAMDGRTIVLNKQFENSKIDLKELNAGIYMLSIESNTKSFTTKIEKK